MTVLVTALFRCWTVVVAAAVVLVAAPATAALPPAGTLDRGFGGDGRVTTEFGVFSRGEDAVLQPDGRIVVVGTSFDRAIGSSTVARYRLDGSLDPTFSGDGRVIFGYAFDDVRAGAIDALGRIVVAGHTDHPDLGRAGLLLRFLPNGILDAGFGQEGSVLDFPARATFLDIAVQADGRILTLDGGRVSRYTVDGSLDGSFGSAGRTTLGIFGRALTLDHLGRIVVAGQSPAGEMAVLRLTGGGALDATFGNAGVATLGLPTGAVALALAEDGRIVVAGLDESTGAARLAVARLRTTGVLDASFSGDGRLVTARMAPAVTAGVVVQRNGKVVVGSSIIPAGMNGLDFALIRFTARGVVDSGFGTLGVTRTDFGGRFDEAAGFALQPDGKIIAVGSTSNPFDSADSDFALARFHGDPPCTITGTRGNDALAGTAGADVICGLGGDDVIDAGGGDDAIAAGPGNDVVRAGSGADAVFGGDGNDILRGGDGADSVFGDGGSDTMVGGAGSDSCDGGVGVDAADSCERVEQVP